MDNRGTLADFLRAARSRLAPADAGLPALASSTRRVPGLRRDEVAVLAGVSVDYYTRMEQGRVQRASDAVINALSSALRLSETERSYLFGLLSSSDGGRPAVQQRSTRIRPAVQQILDQLDVAAGVVFGAGMDVLAMNGLAKSLMHDFTRESGQARSMARWTFLAAEAKAYYLDWEKVAFDVVAILRRDASRLPNDTQLHELIGELTIKSDEFRRWWPQHKVYEWSFGTKRVLHPIAGRMDIDYETFPVPGDPSLELCVYTAANGSASQDALRILASWDDTARPEQARTAI